MDELYQEYIEEDKRFARHIDPEDNRHIFFSGKYGVGKSTFIRKFFEKNQEEYYSVFLTPVDYVVSSNENIFELIKADIIRHLFLDGHLKKVKKSNTSKAKAIGKTSIKNSLRIIPSILSSIDKLNVIDPFIANGVSVVAELVEEIKDIHTEAMSSLEDAADKLDKYNNEIQKQLGTHLESNIISELIKDVIKEIAKSKKPVLIIDDLDRLDPEHIFRILNILSAHNNKQTDENKFGFSKVIIIAHYDSIKETYLHRYGMIDFSGYIDKFYSQGIFKFQPNDVLRRFINERIGNNLPDYAKRTISFLLVEFVNNDSIKFRTVIKALQTEQLHSELIIHKIDPHEYTAESNYFNSLRHKKTINIHLSSLPFVKVLRYLVFAFGSIDEVAIALKNIGQNRDKKIEDKILEDIAKTVGTTLKFTTRNQTMEHIALYFHIHIDKESKVKTYAANDNIVFGGYKILIQWLNPVNYDSNTCFYMYTDISADSTRNNTPVYLKQITNELIGEIEKLNYYGTFAKLGL
jgi:GTP-binding protein EngB required for normal cell division